MTRFSLLFLLLFVGCYRVPDSIEPRVSYCVQQEHFAKLSSPFPKLSPLERQTAWGTEWVIAHAFANELDLYRAISTFKRAQILLPDTEKERLLEVQYDILLCYFLGKKYDQVIDTFETSALLNVDPTFAAYHDLLLILYESYRELCNPEKQARILELMEKSDPETAEKLKIAAALQEGDISAIEQFASEFSTRPSYLDDLLTSYEAQKKSVATAQGLNALLPGAGYFYIGQKKSGVTAFFLNGLFIAAAVQFFRNHQLAAGIITTSFEAGWYFGGIYGAGEEAKYYNERIYENLAKETLSDRNLFPVLMMNHAF